MISETKGPDGGAQAFGRAGYPSLLEAAGAASAATQKTHFILLGSELWLLTLGAVASTAIFCVGQKDAALWMVAAIIFLSFFLSLLNRLRRYERRWFDCRAVAESIKSLTWRYVAKADPFEKLDGTAADLAFIDGIGRIRKEREAAKIALAAHPLKTSDVITKQMRDVREMDAPARARMYLTGRLENQISWYGRRATSSARSEAFWFWGTSALQAATLVVAVIMAASKPAVSLSAMMTTAVAGATAWARAKRFGDLAQSYRVAEHELIELKGKQPSTQDDAEVAKWVEEVELLISREHTMWFAKLQS